MKIRTKVMIGICTLSLGLLVGLLVLYHLSDVELSKSSSEFSQSYSLEYRGVMRIGLGLAYLVNIILLIVDNKLFISTEETCKSYGWFRFWWALVIAILVAVDPVSEACASNANLEMSKVNVKILFFATEISIIMFMVCVLTMRLYKYDSSEYAAIEKDDQ